jgi:glycosyltransferase involved in cell wall biosynthesis
MIKELRKQGHEVVMVPMYLPILLDNEDLSGDVPVFFGGINVYLQQNVGLFRKTPRWFDKFFDSKWLLAMTAKKAGSTKADGLGSMTLSMLEGENGKQAKELERLVSWLEEQEKPDLVHISNALLAGMAESVKKRLGVPVVCTLQDEDDWIDALDKPFDELCWNAISEKAGFIDAFIAVSEYFANSMCSRINVSQEKMNIVPVGADYSGFIESSLPDNPPVIGYMARMSESMGLDKLVDTFIELKKDLRFSSVRLRICGGEIGDDIAFTERLKRKLVGVGLIKDVDFVVSFDRASRIDFLSSLTLLSVPTPKGTAFGTYVIEALGAGVPVVEPDMGAYRELINGTGGGVLYDPNDEDGLLDALMDMLSDKDRLAKKGRDGKKAVMEKYSVEVVAPRLSDLYKRLVCET